MKKTLLIGLLALGLYSCKKDKTATEEPEFFINEDAATFKEIGSLDIGETLVLQKFQPSIQSPIAFL